MIVFTLGEKIRAKRKENNMTLKELAGDRITPGQISLVESGKSNPSNELLQYIADRLKTSIDYFLENEDVQAKRICEYYVNVAEISFYLDNNQRAENAVDKGLAIARKYMLSHQLAMMELIKAKIKFYNKEIEAAQQLCISANSLFLKENNIEYSVKSFMLLGDISYEVGYLNTALNYYTQGEEILRDNDFVNELLRAELFHNISKCYSKVNKNENALNYAQTAMERLSAFEDKKGFTEALLALCIKSEESNKLDEALRYSIEAKKIFNQVIEVHNIAEIETNLGEILSKAKKIEIAVKYFNSAIKLKSRIKDITIAHTLLKLSEAYNDNNEFDKALATLKSVRNLTDNKQPMYKVKGYEQLFNIYYKMGDLKKAEAVLLEGVKYLEALDYKKQLGDFYSLLGKLYIEMNNKNLALDYISKGIDIYKDLGIILNE